MIGRLLREPLLHFLLLGALLFAAYALLNRGGFGAPEEILVSRAQLEGLRTQFERVWRRPPTAAEQQALVDSWVRDEIYYREALAMGLERDDPVVRRRLSQKVQFIVDSGVPAAPGDAELQAWLDANAERYRLEPRYALQQVYFDPARHGDALEETLAAARRGLARGADVPGDGTLLPASMSGGAAEVAGTFGAEFESALRGLPVGGWEGPVRSAYGLHLVRLEQRSEGRQATLAQVRADVERDWLDARAQAAADAYYERLREKYAVTVEDGGATAAPAG